MKKLLLITLALTAFINTKAQDTAFKSATQNFSITYPKSWTLMDKAAFPIIEFGALAPRENEEDKFSENVNIVVDSATAPSLGVGAYRNANIQAMKTMLSNFTVVSHTADKTNAGLEVAILIYTHSANGFDIKALTYFCKANDRYYAITCSATIKEFEKYKATFLTICRSIEFN